MFVFYAPRIQVKAYCFTPVCCPIVINSLSIVYACRSCHNNFEMDRTFIVTYLWLVSVNILLNLNIVFKIQWLWLFFRQNDSYQFRIQNLKNSINGFVQHKDKCNYCILIIIIFTRLKYCHKSLYDQIELIKWHNIFSLNIELYGH